MNTRRGRTPNLAFFLMAAILTAASVSSAFGSGEPQESFLYQNLVRASEVLDRAIAAHGGAELLDRTVNVRFSFTGPPPAELVRDAGAVPAARAPGTSRCSLLAPHRDQGTFEAPDDVPDRDLARRHGRSDLAVVRELLRRD